MPEADREIPDVEAPEQPDGKTAPSLAEKLVEVMAEVTSVEKDGHNDFHDYDYTTAEAMLAAIRGPLSERGIILCPSVMAVEKQGTLTTMHLSIDIRDSESDEKINAIWYGTGDDKGDKGLYKAYTGALKTFLRAQFLLPMEHDPEADESTDKRGANDGQPEPRTLPADAAERLAKIVEDAGLTSKLKTKLRSFGVKEIGDLTVEQATALHTWAMGKDS